MRRRAGLCLPPLVDHRVRLPVCHLQDEGRLDAIPAVREDAVRLRQIQQPHLAAPQRDRQPRARVPRQRRQPRVGGKLHHRRNPNVIQRHHRRNVERRCQRLADQHRTMLDQSKVPRRIALQFPCHERRRHVEDHRRCRPRVSRLRVERRRVSERLERAARLSHRQRRVHRPVDPLVEVIRAAQHCQHLPRKWVDGDQRRVIRVRGHFPRRDRVVQVAQLQPRQPFRRLLPVEVNRRDHVQPVLVQAFGVVALQLLDHRHHEMRRLNRKRTRRELKLIPPRRVRLRRRQVAVLRHQIQHRRLSVPRRLDIRQRVIRRRRLQQPRQQRALAQRQIRRGFAEIRLRRRLNSIREVAKIGLVQVQRQHVILAVCVLKLHREDHLPQLAPHRTLRPLLRVEQQIPRHLLRDRAPPGDHLTTPQVDPHRACDPGNVHAGVLVKIRILHADHRPLTIERNALQRDRRISSARLRVGKDFIQQPPVAVVNPRRRQRLARVQLVNRRQIREQPHEASHAQHNRQRAKHQRDFLPPPQGFKTSESVHTVTVVNFGNVCPMASLRGIAD